jgi:hypothetical protein
VVGTGGAYPTPFLIPVAHSETRDASRNGVLRLRLHAAATTGNSWKRPHLGYRTPRRPTTAAALPLKHPLIHLITLFFWSTT